MADQTLFKQIKKLARDITGIDRRVRAIELTSQSPNRSVTDGQTVYYDGDGNVRNVTGYQPDGSYTSHDYNSPATQVPSAPIVTARAGTLTITWDGLDSDGGGIWPADFRNIEVHMDTVPGAAPTDANQVATFSSRLGGTVTFALDAIQYYFVFTYVNTSLSESSPSVEVSGTPLPPETGSGGVVVYRTDTPPAGLGTGDVGDLWFDTNNNNALSYWDGATWVLAQDSGAALLAAQDAQATADGKVQSYFEDDPPWAAASTDHDADVGDLWFDTNDGNKLYRWGGAANRNWIVSDDQRISTALTNSADALTEVSTKASVTTGTTPPSSPAVGDIWQDTNSTPPAIKVWNGTAFIAGGDAAAQALAASKNKTTVSSTAPASPSVGDQWQDTVSTPNTLKTWDGSTWVIVGDVTARNTAATKITTFYTTNPPTSTAVGDIWIDVDDENHMYRANAVGVNTIVTSGNGWYDVQDGAIQTAINLANGALPAPTAPPSSSPAPTVVGNIRTILGTFTAVPGAQEYEIYLTANGNYNAPDADHLVDTVTSTQFQISRLPTALASGSDPGGGDIDYTLQYGVIYNVAVWAKNSLGKAPAPSNWSTGVTLRQVGDAEVDASIARFGDITFDNMYGGTFQGTVVWGGKLTTRGEDTTAPGGELDSISLRGYGVATNAGEQAPLVFEVPFTPDPVTGLQRPAYYAGDVEAQHFTSYDGADLFGDDNNIKSGGGLFLESGSSGVGSAPSIDQSVPSTKLTVSSTWKPPWNTAGFNPNYNQMTGFHWDSTRQLFYVTQNTPGGAVVWSINPFTNEIGSTGFYWQSYEGVMVFHQDGRNAWLARPIGGTNFAWWNAAAGVLLGFYNQGNTTQIPIMAMLAGGSEIRIFENVSGRLRVTPVSTPFASNPTLGSSTDSSSSFLPGNTGLGSALYGNNNYDLGIATTYTHVVCARNVAGTIVRFTGQANQGLPELPDYEFQAPLTAMVGVAYSDNGTVPGWYGLGMDGRLYKFNGSNIQTGINPRHVAAVTQATSSSETQLSSKVTFNLKSRWITTVTGSSLDAIATRQGVYLYRGSSNPTDSQMHRQGYTNTGSNTFKIVTPNYTGVAPGTAPTSGAYPVQAPAWIRSAATNGGTPSISLNGDGSWRLGDLSADATGKMITKSQPLPPGVTQPYLRYTTMSAPALPASGSFVTMTGWSGPAILGSCFSSFTGGSLTCSVPGTFAVKARIGWATEPDSTARLQVRIYKNGFQWVQNDLTPPTSTRNLAQEIAWDVQLTVGDMIDVRVGASYQNTSVPTLSSSGVATSDGHELTVYRLGD